MAVRQQGTWRGAGPARPRGQAPYVGSPACSRCQTSASGPFWGPYSLAESEGPSIEGSPSHAEVLGSKVPGPCVALPPPQTSHHLPRDGGLAGLGRRGQTSPPDPRGGPGGATSRDVTRLGGQGVTTVGLTALPSDQWPTVPGWLSASAWGQEGVSPSGFCEVCAGLAYVWRDPQTWA